VVQTYKLQLACPIPWNSGHMNILRATDGRESQGSQYIETPRGKENIQFGNPYVEAMP